MGYKTGNYINILKKLKEEKENKNNEVYVVEDSDGKKVNQDRLKAQNVGRSGTSANAVYEQKWGTKTGSSTKKTTTKQEDNDTWFQSSKVFDDGYDFGDITKTILGTVGDVGLGVVKGVANIGEGIGDLGAYGVAGLSELFGNQEYAEKVRTKAQENLMDELFKPAEDIVEQASIIGEKGDSVSQGLGYVGSIIATGGLGSAAGLGTLGTTALTTGLTGLSSMGSGMSEAYQDGATDEEALKYGIISGVAEAGSELIFGGLGKAVNAVGLSKGLSSLDDTLAKKISSKISSTLGKNIAEYTVKAGAEGVEEVVSGIAQGIGKKVTYMSDKELVDILKDEKLLDQFIVGAVTSSIAQAPGLVKTTNQGRDFVSGYTQNEQKVIDAEVENRVNEKEATGIELTNKEISKIREEVETDFNKGYISTDTIENTLGKKLTEEQEADIEAQLNTLLQQSKTADPKQITEIDQQMDMLSTQLQTSRNLDFSKDTYIQKSYQEKELRKEHYTYETTDNEKINKLNESASKYMNNTTRTHEMVDTVAKLVKNTDKQYEFINTEGIKELGYSIEGKKVNGLVTKDGKILINIDNDTKLLETVIGHETTHLLEGTAEYQALQDTAIEYAKTKGIYNDRIQALEGLYKGTNANIKAELTSDLTGELLFTDQSFIESLSAEQPNVFQKIYNYIKHIYKMVTAGSKEARQLEELKYRFDQAYKKAGKQAGTDTKYSIQGLESYTDDEIKTFTNNYIQEKLEENDIYDVIIKDTAIHGSRGRGTARPDSDLDIVVEFEGDIREDDLFNILNEDPMYIDGIQVDINPITADDTGTLEEYMERSKAYDEEILSKNKTKYSLTDNQGRILSKEQQEYFKNSKARDKNGNLVTVYHGTMFGGFTEFSHEDQSIGNYRFGDANVNFFTSDKGMAVSYSDAELYEAEKIKTPKLSTMEDVNRVIADKNQELFEANREFDADYSKDNRLSLREENGSITLYDEGKAQHTFKNETDAIRNINSVLRELYGGGEDAYGESYYEGYLNITNPYIVDAKGSNWKYVDKEFSQDIYGKFKSLTQTEKDYLTDLSEWDDYGLFKDTLEEANKTVNVEHNTTVGEETRIYANIYSKLKDAGISDIYSVVLNDFSDKTINQVSIRNLTTNDIVKKALQDGSYDGVIIKNVVDYGSEVPIEKPGDLYVTIGESNQFKNIDNTNPTADPDIRYSLSEDTQGRKLSKEQIERYKDVSDKLKDENGNLKVYYHGTKRADRVGTIFDPNKATSGPMAFFTDNADIAKNYSENKADTSLSREYDTEYDLFKADGQDLDTYWNSLSYAEKQKINKEGNNVGFDDNWEDIVYGENASENSFSDMYKWYLKNETNGNGIKALYQVWVQDGNIMDDDLYKFQEVLEKAGVKNVEFLDPDKVDSKVYETYLNIKNPFDTSEISEEMVNKFKEAAKDVVMEDLPYVADMWDKTNITPEMWLSRLESDLKDGTTHTWTSIPDWVTDVLKQNGYDGIVDTGGKHGGTGHQVVIPFYSNQVKNVDNTTPTDNIDINMSLSAENDIAPIGQRGTYGKDVRLEIEEAIAPLQETIKELSEQLDTVLNSTEQLPETAPVQEVQPTQPTLEEVQNLIDIRDNKSGSEYARAFFALRDKYGQAELYKSLNEYYSTGTVTQPSNVRDIDTAPVRQDIVEKQGQEAFNTITDNDAPKSFEDIVDEVLWNEEFESEPDSKVESPLDNRDIDEVGNRKVKAYQYENPDVKPYFQAEAQNMLYDLDNTIKGERIATQDEEGYITGWAGITRQTTEAIAYLKDNYGYSYDQIRQGLNKIIEDDGKENNAVSKRIEFMLDERLREGYTTSDGIPIPVNEDYVNFLKEKQVTEYNKEAFNAITDEDMPLYEKIESRELPVSQETAQGNESIPMKIKTAQNQNTEATEGKQRKWVKTSTESEVVNREILPDDLDQDKIMYQPITNKATLNTANVKLGSLGYEKAVEYFNNQILNKKTTVEDIALGERLIQEAIKNKDTKTAGELIQNVAILGTELGQKVQALSIIQRMTPEGQLKMLEKTINRNKVKGDKAFNDVNLTDDMRKKILDTYKEDGSYNQEELNKAVDEVKQEIADQMPSTMLDKVNSWRYLSMLGNPKTHIRNLVSNVAMKGTTAVKNAVARTIETIAPIENRTKTWKMASDDVINFAKQTTLEMKGVISGDSKYSEQADIKAKRKIFENQVLEKVANLNSDLLEKEDWWFSKGAFESSFREFLTANGIETQQDIQNNPELIEKGKLYATEQAQIATFRQYSWLANKIRDIESKNTATSIAVGAVLPFKKTPINIAKTGLSYSPLGFAKTLTYDIAQVKKGNMEASTLIDHLAQNTTGTALTLVGYMLAQAGFLNGAGDDDKEGKYDYQLGKQAYSINIGGNTYSLSWLSPVAMPLFVGTNAYEQLVEGEEWNADVVLETLGQTLDPLSEMSFLSSLDSVLSSYDSGVQRFFGIGEAMLQNYATQFVPTASSQLAATLDDTKRTTKVAGDSNMKVLEETYNKLIYKIPGLRATLEPTTDIWGNEVKQSEDLLQRAFENFISPYARKESIATEIDAELKDLFSQTGDNGILPSIPSNYVNYDGERYDMSAKEYTDYKKTYGQTANDLLEDLFRTTTYQNASSEERTDMVNDVYDYARDLAKQEYLDKEGVEYTNATEKGKVVYKENLIKGAVENDMTTEEYGLYVDDPEEYKFLMKKDYEYRRKYFDTSDSLKEIENSFSEQKDKTDDDDELDALYSDKKTSIIDKIIKSGLEDTEKASLYKKYYNSDTVDTVMKTEINLDDYLTYETKEFKADKNEKGNSIPGSRKDKVIAYVNTLDMSIAQKAILIKSTNTFKFNDYNDTIVQYVDGLAIDYEDKVKILKDLDFEVDKEGNVFWD